MTAFVIEQVDTWFFRGGTPYSAEPGAQLDVGGTFPPTPSTTAGAVRAALATAWGWDGASKTWPNEFNAALGDGPDDLGALRLQGPFVASEGELLFPVPRHVWTRDVGGHVIATGLLRPGSSADCDIGSGVTLPELAEGAKPAADYWLDRAAMEGTLRGAAPRSGELIRTSDLWREEMRTGIERDPGSRSVKEGMLYSSRHTRLCKGTALMVEVSGIPAGRPVPGGAFLFGGEARMAFWDDWPHPVCLDTATDAVSVDGRFIAVVLTPLAVSRETILGREPIEALGAARVVCACLDRPMRIGGWDTLTNRPLPMRNYVAPGTALFCECPSPDRIRDALRAAPTGILSIGERTAAGYGCVAIGKWPD